VGITAFPFSSVIDVPTARILARDDAGTGPAEALTNLQLFAILGTGTPSASTYLRGDGTWAAVSAGVGGSTGSVDNAVLRADGAGGATLQASSIVITDNFTSSPNATVNHASIQATGATTNVSVSVVPKGSGAFSLAVPDGTATGGNARGANSVDLQTSRASASQVCGSPNSIIAGQNNTSTGTGGDAVFGVGNVSSSAWSLVAGNTNTVSQYSAICAGGFSTVSGHSSATFGFNHNNGGNWSVCAGNQHTIDAAGTYGTAFGNQGRVRLPTQAVHACGQFASVGDCQWVRNILRGKTTTNAAVELVDPTRFVIPAGFIFHGTVRVSGAKSDGSAVAAFERQLKIKRVGNTTSLVGTVNTIGTDEASGTSLSITADDTNESAKIEPTGVLSETWRWEAVIEGGLYAYGT
jgi:hypothetical protein